MYYLINLIEKKTNEGKGFRRSKRPGKSRSEFE